ncbi:CGNR zinc finger domain-containing protein [Methylophaga pinxianii]|uniref:CGNR zinc finger domain-containing protein n=1 Tax=Methylophaga pinxianii TaxID=2881052 RepID=UPI001CF553F2|nr:CGNR zinc finger domain-containing protein [Methylophaga pinxianii]MCB2425579.1 CGNR zinc finger domain-containing protein [Methylophaga pinxianii]UPH45027.1 CGNR zinc finger domain-containing protein [Methylophaga pinxianii]
MNNEKHNYIFVGNNLSIDFINTEVKGKGGLIDLLRSENDVMEWLEQANIEADLRQGVELDELLQFRAKARHALNQIIDDERLDEVSITSFNDYLKNYKTHYQLEVSSEGYQLNNHKNYSSTADLIGLFAYELANLLASDQRLHLKRCLNPDCVLMFVDNSRSHKRRWCSMDICGNRAKVSKHYQKTKS